MMATLDIILYEWVCCNDQCNMLMRALSMAWIILAFFSSINSISLRGNGTFCPNQRVEVLANGKTFDETLSTGSCSHNCSAPDCVLSVSQPEGFNVTLSGCSSIRVSYTHTVSLLCVIYIRSCSEYTCYPSLARSSIDLMWYNYMHIRQCDRPRSAAHVPPCPKKVEHHNHLVSYGRATN